MASSPNLAVADRMADAAERFFMAGCIKFVQDVVEITTRGGTSAPAAAIDEGELRASPRVTVGGPLAETSPESGPYANLSRQDVSRAVQLGGFGPGDEIHAPWIAGHSNIIEGGRRMGSHGRMIGSTQNPQGFLGLAIEEALGRLTHWRYDDRGGGGVVGTGA